ncbi:MAG TPA: MBL fold metallo-hydrolase [Syntrophorhabdaceae bacterium]|nr:MBL fold metallo-hydrolase [Syntrophorhabdaceae bacterium]HQM82408.1 MBL fold metallo-hydrolase [Syntrophorhabdaceae bacterium]
MKKSVLLFLVAGIFLFAGIANADVKGARAVVNDIRWLGHDTFRIQGEKVIYTDPFKIKNKDTADIILITHGHSDHCSEKDIKAIQGDNTVIVTPPSCTKGLAGNVKVVKRGDVINVGGIAIEVVPAYNMDKKFHPKEADGVGYIFTVKGQRIYFAGDTDHIPEMKGFRNVNIALLPVSGKYVMTAEEAVRAALDIKPDIAVPMHYGSIVGTESDAKGFAGGLKGKIEVIIMKQE